MPTTQANTWWRDFLWLAIVLTVFFSFALGTRALSVPDEGRYAEIPREMLQLHDFITPHLDGVKYFEKPVWMYWVGAAAQWAFGASEWAVRLPTMLMALLGCLITYGYGRWLFNRGTGLLASGILATSLLYFAMAHSLTLDMTLSVWLGLSFLSFITAVDLPRGSTARTLIFLIMFASAGLAVLTKGLVGMVFPAAIAFLWCLVTQRWRELRYLPWVSGVGLFLLITVPWHYLVQQQNPEFFHFYVIEQHFTRYFTKAMNRYQPWWWFFPILIGGFIPWTFFLPQAFSQVRRAAAPYRQRLMFLMIWASFIFVFFSLSDSKLIPYLVPIFPALALLVAYYFQQHEPKSSKSLWYSAMATAGFLLLITLALLIAPHWDKKLSHEACINLRALAILSGLWAVALGWWCLKAKRRQSLSVVLLLGGAIFAWGLLGAAASVDTRPIKDLALTVKALAGPQDWVVSYNTYYQDLPFYSQRLVTIVDWRNELSFGLAHQPEAQQWLMDSQTFWQKANHTQQTIFLVMDADVYQRLANKNQLQVLAQSGSNVLLRMH